MNQELTLFSRLPLFLLNELITHRGNRNDELIDLLFDNFMVLDDEGRHYNCIMESFQEFEYNLPIVKQYFDEFTKLLTSKTKTYSVKKQYSDINLCKASRDKIFVAPDIPHEHLTYLKAENQKLKICGYGNLFEVVRPLPARILLRPSYKYDLGELTRPYAKGSKTITILDPYITNEKAEKNLKVLLSRTNYEKIHIRLNHPNGFPPGNIRDKYQIRFDALAQYLEKSFGDRSEIRLDFFSPGHEERFIIFDEVQVYIPGGLDFLDSAGMIKSQKRGLYIRFEKRDFEAFPINQELNPVNP